MIVAFHVLQQHWALRFASARIALPCAVRSLSFCRSTSFFCLTLNWMRRWWCHMWRIFSAIVAFGLKSERPEQLQKLVIFLGVKWIGNRSYFDWRGSSNKQFPRINPNSYEIKLISHVLTLLFWKTNFFDLSTERLPNITLITLLTWSDYVNIHHFLLFLLFWGSRWKKTSKN